ncbi:MAG: UDP-N-acetylglucosamine 2-epimerase [Candidatus Hodarchaeota archaeon]
MPKKHICVVTGTRAEYGILKLLLQKIRDSSKLKLSLLVTGMHLLEEYGKTIDIIRKDGIPIVKEIPMYKEKDHQKDSIGRAVGRALINFTEVLNELNPDLLLVFGDRFEAISAVIAASTLFIPIAHIHGGDNVNIGQVDKQIRHSMTKLAHLHFPATQRSAERIRLLGEEEKRIFMVGSPSIDMIYKEKLLTKKEICEMFNFDPDEKIVLCVHHPYLSEKEDAGNQMKVILQLLKEFRLQTIIIYPNNDPGNELIIKEIEANKNIPKFRIFKNLERNIYLSLLKNIDLIIGNSSSGIIETPVFKLAAVNIGNRNWGREGAENVIDVIPTYIDIKNGIKKGLSEEFRELCQKVKNPYGDGKASERITKILEDLKIDKEFFVKRLSYDV